MRKLYAMSKPIGGKPRRLIGELIEDDGQYTFKYRLGGTFPEWFLKIDEFPQADKVYNGSEVRAFIDRIIPKPDDIYIEGFIEDAGLKKYDEWEFLKYCGRENVREDAFLYEQIPQGARIYE